MNAPEKLFLPDVQASPDSRQLAIQRVGVRGLRVPFALRDGDALVRTVATADMTVFLPAELKGTHMSRFIEVLESGPHEHDLANLRTLLATMRVHLGAPAGRIELAFPWFVRKAAPVSGVESLLGLDAAILLDQPPGQDCETTLRVVVPVTSLCPCSKEISAYGAHNQRSHVTLTVTLREDLTLAELIRIAEDAASCPVFGLLKRADEKWVTERAYDNPKFVEDLVRDLALRLRADPRIAAWTVESENFESIHNHSAYARLDGRNG